jgi:hypothetical protein
MSRSRVTARRNQAKDIDLAPGQEAFAKVLALSSWESGGGLQVFHRVTFYVSPVPPQVARAELANHHPAKAATRSVQTKGYTVIPTSDPKLTIEGRRAIF